jgi:hypothetical protein
MFQTKYINSKQAINLCDIFYLPLTEEEFNKVNSQLNLTQIIKKPEIYSGKFIHFYVSDYQRIKDNKTLFAYVFLSSFVELISDIRDRFYDNFLDIENKEIKIDLEKIEPWQKNHINFLIENKVYLRWSSLEAICKDSFFSFTFFIKDIYEPIVQIMNEHPNEIDVLFVTLELVD